MTIPPQLNFSTRWSADRLRKEKTQNMQSSQRDQYQHFVPQFLLRNFAHPYRPKGGGKRGKTKDENGLHYGESVVRSLDLAADPSAICEKAVKRILGQMNMYEDATMSSPQEKRVEEMLGRLENQVSVVFRKIVKAHEKWAGGNAMEEGTPAEVCLARSERDLIRKFLFILKYRSSGFHRRFYHDTAEDYDSNDKELLREYMAEKGYQRPMDVWYDNIKAIIDLEMDPGCEWIRELPKRMYPDDAMWFYTHTELYYMTICTPAEPDGEFVLTDASYGVFEGPSTFARDMRTGRVEPTAHTPFHMFAPVSPKLMIVLRSFVFPDPLEDADEQVKILRSIRRMFAVDMVYGGEVKGLLSDLPVAKARNSYTRVVGGRLQRIGDYDGARKTEHKFYFPIFQIGSEHVNTINGVLLDNCGTCTSIVFGNTAVFAKTLEWFLTCPTRFGKVMSGVEGDGRSEALNKMEAISRHLGSTKATVQGHLDPPDMHGYDEYMHAHTELHRDWKRFVAGGTRDPEPRPRASRGRAEPKSQHWDMYTSLGGSAKTFLEDQDQTGRMWLLRVKIDSWSHGVDESIRQRNRHLLNEAYRRLPPRRYLLFVKLCRGVIVYGLSIPDRDPDRVLSGPEDAIGRAHHLVKPGKLNRLFYNASIVDIQSKLHSWPDIWQPFTMDPTGLGRVQIIKFSIHELGYIRDCGIQEIEEVARQAQLEILRTRQHETNEYRLPGSWPTMASFLDEGERVELLTRRAVRTMFKLVLKEKVERVVLDGLEKSLFDFAYPTPPQNWHL
ncbi:hypothetical protein B0H67DRAFT_572915 [Lasiosphaeris hirsuta]|uniref:DUF4238 domain-containing protein n=1 Tax=Lasiosphaeris hirsuta TaxID=260670 RepID=A0AA40ANY0_9PEZI|nr:hypothetical protein B0H67DRAFT_572915 [Lasiosphaeris hirsuta]